MKYSLKLKDLGIPLIIGGGAWALSQDLSVGLALFALSLMPAIIKIYIPYANDNPKHLWFKRKLYGWGWTPVTWEGWAVTLVYIALIILFGLTIDEKSSTREIAFTFLLPFVFLTVAFIRILYKKGEKPRWQWGADGKDGR